MRTVVGQFAMSAVNSDDLLLAMYFNDELLMLWLFRIDDESKTKGCIYIESWYLSVSAMKRP